MIDVVIDCGANLGQGYNRLVQNYSLTPRAVHMFDILPEACDFLRVKYPNAIIHNKGVWCSSEKRIVKREKANIDGVQNVGHESNILQDIHTKTTSGAHHDWDTYELECINFSAFLKENFQISDNILLKLDVEGAEYEIIDKLIEDNTISLIKNIHIEWHPHLRTDSPNNVSYYEDIFKANNINILT